MQFIIIQKTKGTLLLKWKWTCFVETCFWMSARYNWVIIMILWDLTHAPEVQCVLLLCVLIYQVIEPKLPFSLKLLFEYFNLLSTTISIPFWSETLILYIHYIWNCWELRYLDVHWSVLQHSRSYQIFTSLANCKQNNSTLGWCVQISKSKHSKT